MTDIVEFLTARLDEDQAAAKEHLDKVALAIYNSATAHPRRKPCEDFATLPLLVQERYRALALESQPAPARVLAEVKAKRRVMARHFADQGDSCVGCGFNSIEERRVEDIDNCPELRDMAGVYDLHPDHKQEWKPIVEFVRREDYFSKPPALPPGWAIATQTPDV